MTQQPTSPLNAGYLLVRQGPLYYLCQRRGEMVDLLVIHSILHLAHCHPLGGHEYFMVIMVHNSQAG